MRGDDHGLDGRPHLPIADGLWPRRRLHDSVLLNFHENELFRVVDLLLRACQTHTALQPRLVHIDACATGLLEFTDPRALRADQRTRGSFRKLYVLRAVVLDLHGDREENLLRARHGLVRSLYEALAWVALEVYVDLRAGLDLDLVDLAAFEPDNHADFCTRDLYILGAGVFVLCTLDELHDQLASLLHRLGRARDLNLARVARLVTRVHLESTAFLANLNDGLRLLADHLAEQRLRNGHILFHRGLQEDGHVLRRHVVSILSLSVSRRAHAGTRRVAPPRRRGVAPSLAMARRSRGPRGCHAATKNAVL
mmetsp:Transcript_34309/g.94575  ORF Transcript_34309/g.94575 Transcript_34309/m.94575 type:complete len:310 (+) Transcript_34309:360-1289(+)